MTDVVWFGACVVLVFLIVKWALGMLKALLVGLILLTLGIGFAYLKGIGPFEQHVVNLETLRNMYCTPDEDSDPVICHCMFQAIDNNIQKEYPQNTLDSLSKDRIASLKLMHEAFKQEQDRIKECMKAKNDHRNPEQVFYASIAKSIGKPELGLQAVKDMILSDKTL